MIEAVIFDMDGVLIDSEPIWRECEIAAFGRAGLRLTEEMCRETMGLRIDEAVNYWHRQRGWEGPTPSGVAEQIIRDLIGRVGREGELLAGARHALDFFRARGVRVALASLYNDLRTTP
jgi:sugar-phosphatase